MNSFHFRRGWKYYASCPLHTILFAILTCAQRTRVHFCPQHWLLCHLGLYQFEFEFAFRSPVARTDPALLRLGILMELVVNKLLILRGFFFADWPFHSTIIFIVELLECFTSTSWRSTGKNMSRIFYQKPAPFVYCISMTPLRPVRCQSYWCWRS